MFIMSRVVSEFLVLSVRPNFAEAIVNGHKTIDIRRQRPNVQPGTLGLVYSSSPVQAVIGLFRVDEICSRPTEELWALSQNRAYMSRQDFDSYFAGTDFGHAIVVSCGQRLPKPLKLSQLRDIWPGCRPPRSFGYLVAADPYSERIMSTFRDQSFSQRSQFDGSNRNHNCKNGVHDHKGLFLLKWDDVRALTSLFRL